MYNTPRCMQRRSAAADMKSQVSGKRARGNTAIVAAAVPATTSTAMTPASISRAMCASLSLAGVCFLHLIHRILTAALPHTMVKLNELAAEVRP